MIALVFPVPHEPRSVNKMPSSRGGRIGLSRERAKWRDTAEAYAADYPDLVAGPGLQEHGLRAPQGLGLEPGDDRPGRDRLGREQVGGADQHADLGAARGQRLAEGRDHRAAQPVVDAAGEQDMDLGRLIVRQR